MKPPLAALSLMVPPLLFAAGLRSQPPEKLPPPQPGPFQLQGVNSCAAAACHNNSALPPVEGGEYGIWIGKDKSHPDKHSRAYEVLCTERSRYIVKNLRGLPSAAQAHPEKEVYCLKCHVHPEVNEKVVEERPHVLQDGVSCEACHGPAEKWLSVHFHDSWKDMDKEAHGMYETKSIIGRARRCLPCHVGTPDSDANHDLLAAGHPRLNFEFAAYHANMPHHWSDAKDKNPAVDQRGTPDFEARAWLIGQALTAEAALNLLAERADPRKKLPWPEFAEYDCYACHHDLKTPSWRQQRTDWLRGSLPFQSWYTWLAQNVLPPTADKDSEKLNKLLNMIRTEMEKPAPRREAIAESARAAGKLLRPWATGLKNQPIAVPQMFRDIVQKNSGQAAQDWDHAVQFFNALAALHNAWTDMPELPPAHAGVREQLVLFGRQLPMHLPYESPRRFNPNSIKKPLEELRKASR
jgi:hypothetical protein